MRLRRVWIGLAATAGLCAAADMPVGIFRGSLDGWEGTPASGEIQARNTGGTVVSCAYDSRSYFERARERVTLAKLRQGDLIEVLADHKPGSGVCYARIVHVLEVQPALLQRPARPKPPASIPMTGPLARGDRSVSGLVMRLESNALWIKTREGQQVVFLRPDTRYLDSGVRVDRTSLPLNERIYVRAGRDIDGEIEAYQVVWGSILTVP
jgi:hypothetical protein